MLLAEDPLAGHITAQASVSPWEQGEGHSWSLRCDGTVGNRDGRYPHTVPERRRLPRAPKEQGWSLRDGQGQRRLPGNVTSRLNRTH